MYNVIRGARGTSPPPVCAPGQSMRGGVPEVSEGSALEDLVLLVQWLDPDVVVQHDAPVHIHNSG